MINVLIIDDSALVRHLLTDILNSADDIRVVGTASDPIFAMKKIDNLNPDVITLDIEMPRMDGLEFLEQLMNTKPLPVIMISAMTQKGCDATLNALELGAVDYVCKPSIDVSSGVAELADEIIRKVKAAARAKVKTVRTPIYHGSSGLKTQNHATEGFNRGSELKTTTDKIIAIGASTGGTQAVTEVITFLPESSPGIVIVQHMPPVFTRSFAERLNGISKLDVKEACQGDRVLTGTALVAPGNKHMTIRCGGAMYYVDIQDGPMVNFVRPSVDVLFRSVAKYARGNAVGVILTGMGEDGARGLLKMKEAGAVTIAQDEATCVVFGMPKKAIEIGAVDKILPLNKIAEGINEKIK